MSGPSNPQLRSQPGEQPPWGGYQGLGLYVTLIGFLVAGLAGIFGPRRT